MDLIVESELDGWMGEGRVRTDRGMDEGGREITTREWTTNGTRGRVIRKQVCIYMQSNASVGGGKNTVFVESD
jgi:hypothetical protein